MKNPDGVIFPWEMGFARSHGVYAAERARCLPLKNLTVQGVLIVVKHRISQQWKKRVRM